jgi:hypothetical protein
VIGLGPHPMSTGDWVFIAVLQLTLILLAVFAVWFAARMTRPGSER